MHVEEAGTCMGVMSSRVGSCETWRSALAIGCPCLPCKTWGRWWLAAIGKLRHHSLSWLYRERDVNC